MTFSVWLRHTALLCLAAFFCFAFSESKYPQGYFQLPIKHTPKVSGTFGELRPNHFHSGIDLKSSNGGSGDPLVSAADGYVSRIKVKASGFGNALYISHPNGYTTVYAHMNAFTPEIEEYVKAQQYKRESFEVDLSNLPTRLFTFKRGEVIGQMGNSGSSSGPHLHFEIRNSRTEKPINPELFGLRIKDTRPPKLHKLKLYALNPDLETLDTRTVDVIGNANSGYRIKGDTLNVNAWRCGFALKAFDHQDGASNWNGIYKLDMTVADTLHYGFDLETFAFSQTRYINAHLDYFEQKTARSYYHRCYHLPGNKIPIYRGGTGVVPLEKNRAVPVQLTVFDPSGNEAKLKFYVRRGEVTKTSSPPYQQIIDYTESKQVEMGGCSLYFPKGSLYENLYFSYSIKDEKDPQAYSLQYNLGDPLVPVHKHLTITMDASAVPDKLRSKAFIAYCEDDGTIYNAGGKWEGNQLVTKNRSLGSYAVYTDTVPPTVRAVSFRKNIANSSKMSFEILDNYPTTGRGKDLSYHGTVDGQWILMEQDGKTDVLTHYFDGRISSGEHEFVLYVTDHCGNSTTYKRNFTR